MEEEQKELSEVRPADGTSGNDNPSIVLSRSRNDDEDVYFKTKEINNVRFTVPILHIDWSWARKLIQLRNQERQAQYQLACLSTLGGGYFLCNKHEVALSIAQSLLQLGWRLNNSALVVRALTFIAVNLKLMGYGEMYHAVFEKALEKAKGNGQLTQVCDSCQLWLEDFEAGLQAKEEEGQELLQLQGTELRGDGDEVNRESGKDK